LHSANCRDALEPKSYALSPKSVRHDPTGPNIAQVQWKMSALRIALAALFLSGAALAQTPGMGETRPTVPGAIKGDSVKQREPVVEPGKRAADSDRAISRCNELSGTLREDCLRQERRAAAAEPPLTPS